MGTLQVFGALCAWHKKEEGVVSRWNVRCKNLGVQLEFNQHPKKQCASCGHARTEMEAKPTCMRAAPMCAAVQSPGKDRDRRFFNKALK